MRYNAFYMKKPGPLKGEATSKIISYYKLLEWIGLKSQLTLSTLIVI